MMKICALCLLALVIGVTAKTDKFWVYTPCNVFNLCGFATDDSSCSETNGFFRSTTPICTIRYNDDYGTFEQLYGDDIVFHTDITDETACQKKCDEFNKSDWGRCTSARLSNSEKVGNRVYRKICNTDLVVYHRKRSVSATFTFEVKKIQDTICEKQPLCEEIQQGEPNCDVTRFGDLCIVTYNDNRGVFKRERVEHPGVHGRPGHPPCRLKCDSINNEKPKSRYCIKPASGGRVCTAYEVRYYPNVKKTTTTTTETLDLPDYSTKRCSKKGICNILAKKLDDSCAVTKKSETVCTVTFNPTVGRFKIAKDTKNVDKIRNRCYKPCRQFGTKGRDKYCYKFDAKSFAEKCVVKWAYYVLNKESG